MRERSLIDDEVATRLHAQAHAERWSLSTTIFAAALEASVASAFARRTASEKEVNRYLDSLRVEDLALATACAEGEPRAWDHFVREYRPILYRSAEAIAPAGNPRELADSLYADLYGVTDRGVRRSLFRYYHGRSTLATWLRAVLAQRHVDQIRVDRRLVPMPDADDASAAKSVSAVDPDQSRFLTLMGSALAAAVMGLAARDRLRLACYYAQGLTLAETGRVTVEHEATVSRQLARTRRELREHVERVLRTDMKLSDSEIQECFDCAMTDPGTLDLGTLLSHGEPRKEPAPTRSIE